MSACRSDSPGRSDRSIPLILHEYLVCTNGLLTQITGPPIRISEG